MILFFFISRIDRFILIPPMLYSPGTQGWWQIIVLLKFLILKKYNSNHLHRKKHMEIYRGSLKMGLSLLYTILSDGC